MSKCGFLESVAVTTRCSATSTAADGPDSGANDSEWASTAKGQVHEGRRQTVCPGAHLATRQGLSTNGQAAGRSTTEGGAKPTAQWPPADSHARCPRPAS